ncbi:hypothetical protein KG088_16585 [Halomonas sp. TRM85114]|uniref:hypothetical protein n=1 Tax=Halomonas jincaotanensis TaxID=2810616 RepID=UPI001BD4254F|nr:hypothetical protein [Halomonas jincaotanensis]MBS9405235.1 hypothetical protein [Halomonas jincaotanensis]
MNTQNVTDICPFIPEIGAACGVEHKIAASRRQPDDGPMTIEQTVNARREAEYVARRNGIKEPLLQLWQIRR